MAPRRREAPLRRAALAAALSLPPLVACDEGPIDLVRGVTTAITTTLAIPAEIAGTPLEPHVAWILAAINDRGGDVTDAELAAHFTPKYLERMTPKQLRAALTSMADDFPPITLDRVRPVPDGRTALLGDSAAGPIRVLLGVDADTGQINTFTVQPYLDVSPPELLAAVPALAARAQLLVAEVAHGACVPVYAVDADAPLSIASTSKLYILLALVDAIVAGELSWDTPLAIRDEWRSNPKSELGKARAGDTFTLREFAEHLIDHSDNNANDHLVHALGRERVEAAVRDSGHRDPDRNVPYITAGEFFHQRLLPGEELDRYFALATADRRAYLDRVLLTRPTLDFWSQERRVDRVGIFASATDLCDLLATLVERAQTEPDAAPALAMLKTGLDRAYSGASYRTFPFIGGKGGGARGILNRTWLLRRDDDRWFAVILGLNDDEKLTDFDEAEIRAITWRIFDLLADEGR